MMPHGGRGVLISTCISQLTLGRASLSKRSTLHTAVTRLVQRFGARYVFSAQVYVVRKKKLVAIQVRFS